MAEIPFMSPLGMLAVGGLSVAFTLVAVAASSELVSKKNDYTVVTNDSFICKTGEQRAELRFEGKNTVFTSNHWLLYPHMAVTDIPKDEAIALAKEYCAGSAENGDKIYEIIEARAFDYR